MGITGLLPFLKGIQRDVHISSFRGMKVAVDSYCWLHKGAYSCAMQLVMKTEKVDNLPFIRYCMKRVNLLRGYNVTPIMVFDGGYLPTKSKVEKDRRERRDAYLQKGKALLKEGKRSEASDCFQKCVDVSPEMALAFIKECRRNGVECIVAPYEADAQLTYLQKEGIVDFVITEDSDMLVFGCKRVLFKMDETGNGKLIDLQELGKANKGALIGFTQDSFRQTCILSGCDYLPSVPGVGLTKAAKLMRKSNQDPYRAIKSLYYESGKVPKGYEDDFRKAEYTFLYQLVFDPRTQKQVRLNEVPDDTDLTDFDFCGLESSPRKAIGMARGNINPFTHEVMDMYSPSKAPPPKSTSWDPSAMGSANRQYPASIQAKLNLTSSQSSKKQFKPPTRAVPVEDASLGDDVLQSMYATTEADNDIVPEPSSQPMCLSRFFAPKGKPQHTPSDKGERPWLGKASRKLKLEKEDTDSGVGNSHGILNDEEGCEGPSPLHGPVVDRTSPEVDCTSPVECPPHWEEKPAGKRLYYSEKYGYNSKKPKLDSLAMLDQPKKPKPDSLAMLDQPKKPKLDSLTMLDQPKKPKPDSLAMLDQPKKPKPDSLAMLDQPFHSTGSRNLFSLGKLSCSPVTSNPATLPYEQPSLPMSQSEDLPTIDTDYSEESSVATHPPLVTAPLRMSEQSSSVDSSGFHSLDSGIDSLGSGIDSLDSVCLSDRETSEAVDISDERLLTPLSSRKQPSKLFNKLISSKNRRQRSVGLSRRGSKSGFKPPRQVESSLRQSLLEQFSFQRRQQKMSLQESQQ